MLRRTQLDTARRMDLGITRSTIKKGNYDEHIPTHDVNMRAGESKKEAEFIQDYGRAFAVMPQEEEQGGGAGGGAGGGGSGGGGGSSGAGGFGPQQSKGKSAEGFVLNIGGSAAHQVIIGMRDARYNPKKLKKGEVILYDHQGQWMHLREKEISVETTDDKTIFHRIVKKEQQTMAAGAGGGGAGSGKQYGQDVSKQREVKSSIEHTKDKIEKKAPNINSIAETKIKNTSKDIESTASQSHTIKGATTVVQASGTLHLHGSPIRQKKTVLDSDTLSSAQPGGKLKLGEADNSYLTASYSSPTAPNDPLADIPYSGFRWIDTTSGIEYAWYNGVWSQEGGATVFPSSPSVGDIYAVANQKWRWNGVGWEKANVRISGSQTVGARKTGWSVPTGTLQRSTYATYTAPTISSSPTQTEVQNIANALQAVSRVLAALITDLEGTAGHGLIGA